ncbi:nuclear mitotic apparatus protein 1 isoform X2 [Carassius gibelio]|uniref:nuclear mitotic apparatus protein 1 isoform X2 n=1 Tax=Carassius gibelio TaxID=101364 RepID=UPI002278DA7B|nr:nuclear mitotic apparatus protein 1 isoform X2 [Carassius gibelio]
MKFNMKKAGPLLAWINTMFPDKQLSEFIPSRDGFTLLKICLKLRGMESTEDYKTLSLCKKVEIIFNVLRDDFDLTQRQSSLILQKINAGTDLELQLAKVALLLCYCTFKKSIFLPMESNIESEITSMFRFIKDDADGLSLDEGLDQFLDQNSVMNVVNSSSMSRGSSLLNTDDESPIVSRFQRPPRVQFQELCTVASSSDRSPVQDVMSTPHFQLKKLRKDLAHEGDVRDELEKELADQISIISEKEGLISQLQHRVERMLREQGELEKDHKAALLELQEKNESLLHRVHEVLKQCQDLKTDNSQKERKIDELTEENGTLNAQVRNAFAQLARADEEVAKLTMAHELAQTEWKSRKEFLEKELNEAVTHRDCLSEQVQILQGKISVLEDELQKAKSQEKGEVLGPILEWEKLKQELADLTLKLAQLQDTIFHLEKEKAEVEALLAEERGSFEKETKRLQMVVFDLEQSINSIRLERETLQEALWTQKEMLTAQISALESDVSRLQQVEMQLTSEIKISADLRQQREELEGKVASLDEMVNALHAEIQGLEEERASQQDALNALIVDLQSTRATIQEYEKKLEEHQKVVQENESLKKEACTLQHELDEHLQTSRDLQEQIHILRQEKTGEENKVSQALDKIESLRTQIMDLSEQISLKDEEIRNLRNEYDSLGNELKLVKEQNIEINEMIRSNRKEHEETVKKLQQELDSASSTALEKQEEMLVLSVEVTSLKEQICRYSENEMQKQQELSFLEAQHNVLKENMTSIQNQLAEVTSTASQKESELHLLQQELCHQETLREKAQDLEKARREELERTVSELQATILEVTSIVSQKEAYLSSLQDEMKDQQLRAKQCEDDLRNELKEKVGNLQELLDTANRDAADKDHLLQSLNQKLKQIELLCQQKEKDVMDIHQVKEDLEKRITEQKQLLDEYQQNLEILRKEKDDLSTHGSSLREEICRSQQEMSVLQADRDVLKENLAALQYQMVELTTTVSQKESELLLLQQELSYQETLREKALELETIKRKEFEKNVSELQAKILEVSTLASQREAQVISLQNEMKDQQMLAKQSEEDLRREQEEKVGTLQGELDMVNRCAADKEKQLGSLDQKLKEMEELLLQKEKDVLETHQAKEELEKTIVKLHVDNQELSERVQNQEILRKERDHLSTEVSCLKDKICGYQDTEVQKQQEISVLEAERNTFREKMDDLEKKLMEETTAASQKQSELVLLKDKVHQQEILREKDQELETAKREELERMVSELHVKILEVSTLASEREACVNSLQDQLTDQLKAKQSEDDLCSVLKEKVESLQGQLETASRDISDKDQLLQTLDQKLKQMDLLCQQREKDVLDVHQVKDDMEKKIGELVVEKQQLLEYQQTLEMVRKERDIMSTEITSLKDEIQNYREMEVQKQQEISYLEAEHNTLKDNLAALKTQVVELTTSASQKESEIQMLQNEVCDKENIKEKAQELEKDVSELQAKILEVSTLASEREAQISSLKEEINDQQLRAKQSENDIRRVLEDRIETLQKQLETTSCDITDKDHLLESMDQKLTQIKLNCQQKEKDVIEIQHSKVDLEKRIGELLVEKQQKLEEYQQNLETVRKERDHLSTEVSSLKDEIQSYQKNEVQKQQEMFVLEAEYNTLKENLVALKIQVVDLTTSASQKESEIQMLKKEVCENENLRERAQELEKDVSELQAKILEVTTLASEKEAQISSLKNEINDQQLRAKQSEDDLRSVLEEKIETLRGELETGSHAVSDKDQLLQTLDQKLKQMDLLCQQREKDVLNMHHVNDDLEKKIGELVFEKQQLLESQHNLEMVIKERDILSTEITSLKDEIQNYREIEVQKQQDISSLEADHNTLKNNLAALKTQVMELTITASQKESEIMLLQKEVCDKENFKEKAQELEKDVSELQAKILEVSTLSSEREAQISSLKKEINDQQLRAKQSENDLCRVLEEKIETLQKQLETTSCDITDKDKLLESMDQKLTQIKLNCQQKEKDVLEIQHSKVDLEKRIDELLVEEQQKLEEYQQNLETVRKERDHLSTEVSSLKDEIRNDQEEKVQKQQEILVLVAEHTTLKENLASLKMQVVELTTSASQKESEVQMLKKEVCENKNLRERAQELEKDVSELQAKILEVSTLASEREAQINSLKDEINDQQLRAKQSEDDLRRVLEEKIETLQEQLETSSRGVSDKDRVLQSLDQKLRKMELLCQQREKDVLEMHQAKEDLEKRIVEINVDKRQLDGYQKSLEMLRQEKDQLSSLKETLQRECDASQKIRAELELMVKEQNVSILALKKDSQKCEEKNQELLEQLKTKSEAVEHYKAQVEKAKNHYNGKKQLLVEAQELNKALEQSLEASKREVKDREVELALARIELDQAHTKEKKLAAKVKSLEAQVDFADRQLREKRMMTDDKENMRHRESLYIRVPEKQQDTSTDSLEFELNDSLNANSHSAVPGESSTPLVRSSERLAAKRRALGAESLETLYFTPLSQQGKMRKGSRHDAFEHKLESSITSIDDFAVDSAKKLTASARRRHTTQVINITLAKASGSAEEEESFSSLHSARSQPNLAVQHSRPFSMDFSEESAATLSKADTLQNLPGYRRSTVQNVNPPRATSTFCIGAENEPEHVSDDWMRIAELQTRNKACLPHLKSSYPLESRPSLGPSFTVTDEDLRLGDPDETIRRASMMPSQILESLNSRRFSLAPSSSQSSANSQPQRATMLPGQIRSSTAAHRAAQLTKTSSRASESKRSPLAPKRPGSQLQGPDTPEAKKLASCFPRPMTPKARFGNSQNRPPKSPAERRQSLMFTVENTPKNSGRGDSRLQRGLNKLRNSARKSPAVASRALRSAMGAKSPLDSTRRKSPRNKSPKSSNAKKETQ